MILESTICALSTGSSPGAIAVIRLSGPEAFFITEKVFSPTAKSTDFASLTGYKLLFGKIEDKGTLIDEVLVSFFRNPKSFTGEDMVEISCHGSQYIIRQIVNLLILNGASAAKPGEFTQRAFLNGKMDLSEAEAVADLIASNSKAAHKMAMNQMKGGFAKELVSLRNELLKFGSLVELELDFAEEDVEFADRKQLSALADTIENHISKLANSFQVGNAIKNGIPVAIVGETNVGKSTLLNALLKEEKAIVSDIHGTTRDVIEDTIHLGGVEFRFIDTAGIRQTEDTIENLGIERTFKMIEKAQIVLLLLDLESDMGANIDRIQNIQSKITSQHLVVIGNKIDKVDSNFDKLKTYNPVFLSAKQGTGVEALEQALVDHAHLETLEEQNVVVSNTRHYEALVRALEAIKRVQDGLSSGITGDFLAQDIRDCMHYLGEITGSITTDEMLGYIFKHFCIGK